MQERNFQNAAYSSKGFPINPTSPQWSSQQEVFFLEFLINLSFRILRDPGFLFSRKFQIRIPIYRATKIHSISVVAKQRIKFYVHLVITWKRYLRTISGYSISFKINRLQVVLQATKHASNTWNT